MKWYYILAIVLIALAIGYATGYVMYRPTAILDNGADGTNGTGADGVASDGTGVDTPVA